MAGFEIGALISGAAIAEIIFGLPGVGYQLLHAIFQRDYPVVQAADAAHRRDVRDRELPRRHPLRPARSEDHDHDDAPPQAPGGSSQRRRLALPARWRNPIGIVGAVIVGFVILTAIFGPT